MESLKAREIQAKLQSNTDPKIVNILCALAERDDTLSKQNMALAEAYDRLVNMFGNVMRGVGGMKMSQDALMQKMGLSSASDTVKSFEAQDDQSNATNFMDKKS